MMFAGFAVIWLLPLSGLSAAAPQWGLVLLLAAVLPLLIAGVQLRAGYPDARESTT